MKKIKKIGVEAVKGIFEEDLFEKASALTFYTLLAIIPLFAIAFGIAQELGFEATLTNEIQNQFKDTPQVAEKIIQFAQATLKQSKGSILASLGILVLFYTVFSMLSSTESYFNQIWKIKKDRSLWQKVKHYVPLIILFPLFLVGPSSFLVYTVTQSTHYVQFLSPFANWILLLVPDLIMTLLLWFIYLYIPNTKVSWKSAFISALICALLFHLWQYIYVTFQVHANSYSAIYGSFAAVPLFLIWLNYSWLIVIFGTELTHTIQENTL